MPNGNGNFINLVHGSDIGIIPLPSDGEEFELSLNLPVHPMIDMVRRCGYNPEIWQFMGSQLVVPQTRRFKLVRLPGFCRGLGEVRSRLAEHGKIPQGQWREAFYRVYPQNDGKGHIGIPDPSWQLPDGHAGFPGLFEAGPLGWSPLFSRADDSVFNGQWRWLVDCK